MFYQPIEDHHEPENKVAIRPRSYSSPSQISASDDLTGEIVRPKSWGRPNDSLSKIEEKEETENQDPRGEYKLCGYLYKLQPSGKKNPVPSLRGFGSSSKKRWFVYSDRVCKLYYYKQRNDSEPLGVIDVALATFLFDPENKNEGQFTIRCGNEETVLEASSRQGRMYWLQQLQAARREFSQKRTTTKTPASRTTSTGRPESGLLQEEKSSPMPFPDPHQDLMRPVMRPSDTEKGDMPHRSPSALTDARLALSNLLPNTQMKIFRTNSEYTYSSLPPPELSGPALSRSQIIRSKSWPSGHDNPDFFRIIVT